jgi:uncharacterized protein (TIGR00251 family)
MKIFVKAKPNAKKEEIKKISNTEFVVAVKEPPQGGKANEAIVRALADYFGVAKSRVKIKTGQTNRNKIVEIL